MGVMNSTTAKGSQHSNKIQQWLNALMRIQRSGEFLEHLWLSVKSINTEPPQTRQPQFFGSNKQNPGKAEAFNGASFRFSDK